MIGSEVVIKDSNKRGWVAETKDDKLLIGLYEDKHLFESIECDLDDVIFSDDFKLPEDFQAIDLVTYTSDEPFVSVRIPLDRFALLEQLAAENNHSVEEEVISILKNYIAKHNKN